MVRPKEWIGWSRRSWESGVNREVGSSGELERTAVLRRKGKVGRFR